MKYCTECGAALKNSQAFCTSCGAKGTQAEPKTESETETGRVPEPAPAPKKPMSKKKKYTLLSLGVIMMGIIAAHLIVSSVLDPSKEVQAMDRAVTDGDSDTFFNYITLEENALINKDHYLSYINESDWDSIREQLVQIISSDSKFDEVVTDYKGNDLFRVKKGSILGLYKTYEVEAVPTQVVLKSNLDSTFTIEKIKADLKQEEQVDLVKAYPGTYSITGEASSLFGNMKVTEEVYISNNNNHISELDIDFPGQEYSMKTNFPEAILFVNGKSTGKSLEEFSVLGPFPEDEEISLYAELTGDDGKTLKSNQITQYDDVWGTLHFTFEDSSVASASTDGTDSEEGSGDDAEQRVLDFRDAYEKSLNQHDFDLIADYMLPGSLAEEELIEYLDAMDNKEYTYDFVETSISGTAKINDTTYEITTFEKFIFKNHLGAKTNYEKEKIYTLVKTDSGFKIKFIDIKDTDRNQL
ncbi:TcaA 3rd/4th domain-containing protein [Rossellomorea vietnamensis]|uniref:Zinc-ribbon domain-containing protein n=1 Tax=Rossellomorea aquimaris TaxID=189382 RepID=A0A5D4TP35_9BACI|nr:hypothetical protein [Rossellomorea aquimaris]TYS75806.1 hypothetical protein FZC80_16520 [Rossellomorea aquimaris]